METQEIMSYESVASEYCLHEEAFTLFCENQHVSPENCKDMVNSFIEALVGDYFNKADFAMEYYFETIDLTGIPEVIVDAIDWDYVWETELRHDFYEIDGFIFKNI